MNLLKIYLYIEDMTNFLKKENQLLRLLVFLFRDLTFVVNTVMVDSRDFLEKKA